MIHTSDSLSFLLNILWGVYKTESNQRLFHCGMLSNNNIIDDEKPNPRPKKYFDANGKSLGTCHCLRSEWNGSSMYASWNDSNNNREMKPLDRPGLFGIEQPLVAYSLHKQKRWKLFDDFRPILADSSDSSSDDESKAKLDSSQDKQESYHVKVINRPSDRIRKPSNKPLSFTVIPQTTKSKRSSEEDYAIIQDTDLQTETIEPNITYTADISSRRKQIPSVRRNHETKGKYRTT